MSNPLKAKSIAEFCTLIRARRNLSMRSFADEIGMGFVTVNRVENGLTDLPAKYLKALRPYMSEEEWEHAKELFWREV